MNQAATTRPPLPPFDAASAAQKARMAEDAWNSRDPREQLCVEQEVLPQRLARGEAMTRDDVAQRRQSIVGQGIGGSRGAWGSPFNSC